MFYYWINWPYLRISVGGRKLISQYSRKLIFQYSRKLISQYSRKLISMYRRKLIQIYWNLLQSLYILGTRFLDSTNIYLFNTLFPFQFLLKILKINVLLRTKQISWVVWSHSSSWFCFIYDFIFFVHSCFKAIY